MIIMRIKGGLANQLFQYAAAWALSKRLQQPFTLFFDEVAEKRAFRLNQLNTQVKTVLKPDDMPPEFVVIKNKHVNKALKKLEFAQYQFGDWLYFQQLGDEFQKEFFTVNARNIYLDGYFQCKSYFEKYRADLLRQFSPSYQNGSGYIQVLEQIKSCNSVAIHVRRGDFQLSKSSFHYLLSEMYYRRAIDYVKKRLKKPVFFWFSEDFDWIYNNFSHEEDFRFLKTRNKNGDIDDMMLMKNCNHIITANSTFSWWSAWLNENEDAIRIVPEKQYITEGSIPESWIKLPI